LQNQFFGVTLTSLGQIPNQDFTLLKADLIVQQQYNLGIILGSEYVYKMHAGILRENLEQYEMNATEYTLFKSVTVTHR
jgi:hypothetical protein